MLETIQQVLDQQGPDLKIIIWGHNIHLGDSDAIGLKDQGQKQGHDQESSQGSDQENNQDRSRISLGKLVRETWPGQSYIIGFGTNRGTVTAAPLWGKPAQKMIVKPAVDNSIGHLLHKIAVNRFMLPLRDMDKEVKDALSKTRLERAIGSAYKPDDERRKHYVNVSLPAQFDEFIWFDQTHANPPTLNP
jgi:protein-L-isoaspartate(D-aspartate) O-methyltransferase